MATDVFDIFARISLDTTGYDKALNGSKSALSSFAGVAKSTFSTLAKVGAVAFTGATTAVTTLTKSAVDAYGEYEQLVGGVEKLYGEASGQLMEYANAAFKTSGLSANEYMTQATSLSAALINSLEGDVNKAADLTDVAMKSMSDNVNTFGTDMESVQHAYQGFAKQNYTMLDNLKLGYGGTKQEMERLIKDANEYAKTIGKTSDLSIDSFADIIEAIELVQEKQHIAGTTAKEAATTIQGSLQMTKSAWDNLVAGLANPDADIGKLVTDFTDSLTTTFSNLKPIIETGLKGVGRLVSELMPAIFETIPELLKDILPDMISAASEMTGEIIKSLASLGETVYNEAIVPTWNWITTELPDLINEGLSSLDLKSVGETLSEKLISVFNGISDFIDEIDWEQLGTDIGEFISGVDWKGILEAVAKVIGSIIKNTPDLLKGIFENLDTEGQAVVFAGLFGGTFVKFLKKELTSSETFQTLQGVGGSMAGKIAAGVSAFFVGWSIGSIIREWIGAEEIDAAVEEFIDCWLLGWQDIKDFAAELVEVGKDGIQDVVDLATAWGDFFSDLGEGLFDRVEQIKDYLKSIKDAWTDNFEDIGEAVFDKIDSIKTKFENFRDDWSSITSSVSTVAFDVVNNIAQFASDLKDDWSDFFEDMGEKTFDVVDGIKEDWREGAETIKSKIQGIKDKITGWIDDFKTGITNMRGRINDFKGYFDEIGDKIGGVISSAWNWGRDCIQNFINGANSLKNAWCDTWENFGEWIYDRLHFSEPDKGPLSKESGHPFSEYGPDLVKTFADGVEANKGLLTKSIDDLMGEVEPLNGMTFTTSVDGTTGTLGGNTITFVLADSAGEIIARSTADALDVINGQKVTFAERGLV